MSEKAMTPIILRHGDLLMWTECQKRSRRYKIALLIIFPVTAFVSEAYGQELVRVETEGIPTARVIIENGIPRREVLTPAQQQEFIMRIVERDGRYFWTSRKMTEMSRSESGVYITYTALNGSGFVKVYAEEMRRLIELLPEEDSRSEVRYIEHVSLGLTTITYVGYF